MRTIESDIGDFYVTPSGIYCNNKKLEYVDSGAESIIYKFEDKAIKFYRTNPSKKVLSEDMINTLKKTPTKRIVMPEGTLYENNKLKGLYMPYIEGNQDSVYDLSKEQLIKEFTYLHEDFSTLGEQSIVVEDLRMTNFLCNKENFYLIDTGDYYISRNIKDTSLVNKKAFTMFVYNKIMANSIVQEGVNENVRPRKILKRFKKERKYLLKKYEESIIDYFIDNMLEQETLTDYSKRLVKR